MIKGRRRIEKSRLISKFASINAKQRFWNFASPTPQDGLTAQDQRNYSARQLSLIFKIPLMTFLNWSDAFEHLSLHIKEGDIIFFDEVSWMGAKDLTFIPKLKAWWDKQIMHVLLVFCESVSTWIEENILKSTAFFGRINLIITLDPLTVPESAEFLKKALSIEFNNYGLLSLPTQNLLLFCPWSSNNINCILQSHNLSKILLFF